MDRSPAAKWSKLTYRSKRKTLTKEKNDSPPNATSLSNSPATTPMLPPEKRKYVVPKRLPDSSSVTNTCPARNEILALQTSTALFSWVLPFVMRKLDLKTMLACRLVDKSTKLAVDTTLRNDLTSPEGCYKVIGFLPRNDTEYYNELSNLQDAFIFLNNRKAEKFMGMVGNNGQNNPIIGGKLSCRVGACLEKAKNDSFMSLDCFESLLKRFGKDVSHLKVTLAKCRRHSSVDNEKISIEKIVSLLVHLPNVEVLALNSTKEVIKVDKIEKQFPHMNKLR
ncbi:unnamed protein product [Orchesella dallaii]|uniref:Uncharacterized protein n=1 Tax=Orchesella dallaii TaxID=48710 RepID=A0ABP1RKQ0_9HEXA